MYCILCGVEVSRRQPKVTRCCILYFCRHQITNCCFSEICVLCSVFVCCRFLDSAGQQERCTWGAFFLLFTFYLSPPSYPRMSFIYPMIKLLEYLFRKYNVLKSGPSRRFDGQNCATLQSTFCLVSTLLFVVVACIALIFVILVNGNSRTKDFHMPKCLW